VDGEPEQLGLQLDDLRDLFQIASWVGRPPGKSSRRPHTAERRLCVGSIHNVLAVKRQPLVASIAVSERPGPQPHRSCRPRAYRRGDFLRVQDGVRRDHVQPRVVDPRGRCRARVRGTGDDHRRDHRAAANVTRGFVDGLTRT